MDAQTCDYRKNTQLCHCKMVFLLYVSYLVPSLKKTKNSRIVLRKSLANIFHKSVSYRHDIGFHVFILTLWLFYVLAYEIDCLIESMPNTYIRTSIAWLK